MNIDFSLGLAFDRYMEGTNVETLSETDLFLGFPISIVFTVNDREVYRIIQGSALGFLAEMAYSINELTNHLNQVKRIDVADLEGTYILVLSLKGETVEIFDEMSQERFQANWSEFRHALRVFGGRLLALLEAKVNLQKNSHYLELRKSIEKNLGC